MLENNQPVKPFLGLRFVLIGFDSINEPKIRYKLIDGGGVDSGRDDSNCTHVIVDNIVYDDPLCVAARKDCKTVVTGLWVDHSYDIGMPVDFTSIMYRPPKDLNGIPGAKSLVMCLTGYQRQDRDDIMTLVGLMGAQFSKPLVANKVTHLVCYKFEGEKYELGKKISRIKLVNHRWLEDCLKEWEILPETNYNKSGYELEVMEAEAKDSEEEAEDTFLKQSAVENMQKSPYNSKPSFAQARDSPRLGAEMLEVNNIANASSNTKDKLPVQGIDNRSNQSSGLANISLTKASGYNDFGGLKHTTHSELAQPHYQSPFDKLAMNDLTSRSTERTPRSDGKFSASSYTRKTQRNLGELSSNHSGFGKEAMKVDDLSSSFNNPDQTKDVAGSDFFEPQRKNDLLSTEKPTVCSPIRRSLQTSSYGTPNLQKIGNEAKPCIRKSLSPSDKISGVNTSFFDRLHDTGINRASIDNDECANSARSPRDSRFTDMMSSEYQEHGNQNENTSPSSFKRFKMSLSGFADSVNFGSRYSTLPSADIREPRNHQPGAKGSASSIRDQESNDPSSLNPEGNDDSNTKLLKKKMVAKKTLGSRPKLASNGNKKGSLHVDKKGTSQDEAVALLSGRENEKPAETRNSGLGSLIISSEVPKKYETEYASKSKDDALRRTEILDDETETPEDKVEQVLDKVTDEVNAATVELAGKTDAVKEKETSGQLLSMDATASTLPMAPKPGNQGNSPENVEDANISALAEPNFEGVGLKRKSAKGKAPTVGKNKGKKIDPREGVESKEHVHNVVKEDEKKTVKRPAAKSKHIKVSKSKLQISAEEEKENTPIDSLGTGNEIEAKVDAERKAIKPDKARLNVERSYENGSSKSSGKVGTVVNGVGKEPVLFILSGHRLQRKEFQKVIRRLKGRVCRDSHQWSYQATHFVVPDPIRRTEKFFAAAASGRWILKTDYLTASNEAGKFLKESDYEWHKNGLNEDGAINLEAPRKWRLLRNRTGHGAFYGMRIIIYGECIAPPLDTLKRVVKAGDGTILATSPPYTRFFDSGVDYAVVSPGMPRVDAWVQEFLKHDVPCVAADYLVEYVCKPGFSFDKHVLYNTHVWAEKSFVRLRDKAEEVMVDPGSPPPSPSGSEDDVQCKVCGSHDREDVMLICGDEDGSRGCGVGCHIDCCDPPLEGVPEDDWFCSKCSGVSRIAEKAPKKRKKGNSLKRK